MEPWVFISREIVTGRTFEQGTRIRIMKKLKVLKALKAELQHVFVKLYRRATITGGSATPFP